MSRTYQFAAHLRENPTRHETLLWRHLRCSKLHGFYFRRQFPIRCYIVDFYCHTARLAVEVDGWGHSSLRGRDLVRDNTLAKAGVSVLRFSNASVENKITEVIEKIATTCQQRVLSTNSLCHLRTTKELNKEKSIEEEEKYATVENIDNLSRVKELTILQCEKLVNLKRGSVGKGCAKEAYAETSCAENMVRWLLRLGIKSEVERCGACGLLHVQEVSP